MRLEEWQQRTRILANQIHAIDPYYIPPNGEVGNKQMALASYADVAAGRSRSSSRHTSPHRKIKEDIQVLDESVKKSTAKLPVTLPRSNPTNKYTHDTKTQLLVQSQIDVQSHREEKQQIKNNIEENQTNKRKFENLPRRGRSPTRKMTIKQSVKTSENTIAKVPSVKIEVTETAVSKVLKQIEEKQQGQDSSLKRGLVPQEYDRRRSPSPIWIPGSTSYADILRGGSSRAPSESDERLEEMVNLKIKETRLISREVSPKKVQDFQSSKPNETLENKSNSKVKKVTGESILNQNILSAPLEKTIQDTEIITSWADEPLDDYNPVTEPVITTPQHEMYDYMQPMPELVGFINPQLNPYQVNPYIYSPAQHQNIQQIDPIALTNYESHIQYTAENFAAQPTYIPPNLYKKSQNIHKTDINSKHTENESITLERQQSNIQKGPSKPDLLNTSLPIVDTDQVSLPTAVSEKVPAFTTKNIPTIKQDKLILNEQMHGSSFSYAQILSQGLTAGESPSVTSKQCLDCQPKERSISPCTVPKPLTSCAIKQSSTDIEKVQSDIKEKTGNWDTIKKKDTRRKQTTIEQTFKREENPKNTKKVSEKVKTNTDKADNSSKQKQSKPDNMVLKKCIQESKKINLELEKNQEEKKTENKEHINLLPDNLVTKTCNEKKKKQKKRKTEKSTEDEIDKALKEIEDMDKQKSKVAKDKPIKESSKQKDDIELELQTKQKLRKEENLSIGNNRCQDLCVSEKNKNRNKNVAEVLLKGSNFNENSENVNESKKEKSEITSSDLNDQSESEKQNQDKIGRIDSKPIVKNSTKITNKQISTQDKKTFDKSTTMKDNVGDKSNLSLVNIKNIETSNNLIPITTENMIDKSNQKETSKNKDSKQSLNKSKKKKHLNIHTIDIEMPKEHQLGKELLLAPGLQDIAESKLNSSDEIISPSISTEKKENTIFISAEQKVGFKDENRSKSKKITKKQENKISPEKCLDDQSISDPNKDVIKSETTIQSKKAINSEIKHESKFIAQTQVKSSAEREKDIKQQENSINVEESSNILQTESDIRKSADKKNTIIDNKRINISSNTVEEVKTSKLEKIISLRPENVETNLIKTTCTTTEQIPKSESLEEKTLISPTEENNLKQSSLSDDSLTSLNNFLQNEEAPLFGSVQDRKKGDSTKIQSNQNIKSNKNGNSKDALTAEVPLNVHQADKRKETVLGLKNTYNSSNKNYLFETIKPYQMDYHVHAEAENNLYSFYKIEKVLEECQVPKPFNEIIRSSSIERIIQQSKMKPDNETKTASYSASTISQKSSGIIVNESDKVELKEISSDSLKKADSIVTKQTEDINEGSKDASSSDKPISGSSTVSNQSMKIIHLKSDNSWMDLLEKPIDIEDDFDTECIQNLEDNTKDVSSCKKKDESFNESANEKITKHNENDNYVGSGSTSEKSLIHPTLVNTSEESTKIDSKLCQNQSVTKSKKKEKNKGKLTMKDEGEDKNVVTKLSKENIVKDIEIKNEEIVEIITKSETDIPKHEKTENQTEMVKINSSAENQTTLNETSHKFEKDDIQSSSRNDNQNPKAMEKSTGTKPKKGKKNTTEKKPEEYCCKKEKSEAISDCLGKEKESLTNTIKETSMDEEPKPLDLPDGRYIKPLDPCQGSIKKIPGKEPVYLKGQEKLTAEFTKKFIEHHPWNVDLTSEEKEEFDVIMQNGTLLLNIPQFEKREWLLDAKRRADIRVQEEYERYMDLIKEEVKQDEIENEELAKKLGIDLEEIKTQETDQVVWKPVASEKPKEVTEPKKTDDSRNQITEKKTDIKKTATETVKKEEKENEDEINATSETKNQKDVVETEIKLAVSKESKQTITSKYSPKKLEDNKKAATETVKKDEKENEDEINAMSETKNQKDVVETEIKLNVSKESKQTMSSKCSSEKLEDNTADQLISNEKSKQKERKTELTTQDNIRTTINNINENIENQQSGEEVKIQKISPVLEIEENKPNSGTAKKESEEQTTTKSKKSKKKMQNKVTKQQEQKSSDTCKVQHQNVGNDSIETYNEKSNCDNLEFSNKSYATVTAVSNVSSHQEPIETPVEEFVKDKPTSKNIAHPEKDKDDRIQNEKSTSYAKITAKKHPETTTIPSDNLSENVEIDMKSSTNKHLPQIQFSVEGEVVEPIQNLVHVDEQGFMEFVNRKELRSRRSRSRSRSARRSDEKKTMNTDNKEIANKKDNDNANNKDTEEIIEAGSDLQKLNLQKDKKNEIPTTLLETAVTKSNDEKSKTKKKSKNKKDKSVTENSTAEAELNTSQLNKEDQDLVIEIKTENLENPKNINKKSDLKQVSQGKQKSSKNESSKAQNQVTQSSNKNMVSPKFTENKDGIQEEKNEVLSCTAVNSNKLSIIDGTTNEQDKTLTIEQFKSKSDENEIPKQVNTDVSLPDVLHGETKEHTAEIEEKESLSEPTKLEISNQKGSSLLLLEKSKNTVSLSSNVKSNKKNKKSKKNSKKTDNEQEESFVTVEDTKNDAKLISVGNLKLDLEINTNEGNKNDTVKENEEHKNKSAVNVCCKEQPTNDLKTDDLLNLKHKDDEKAGLHATTDQNKIDIQKTTVEANTNQENSETAVAVFSTELNTDESKVENMENKSNKNNTCLLEKLANTQEHIQVIESHKKNISDLNRSKSSSDATSKSNNEIQTDNQNLDNTSYPIIEETTLKDVSNDLPKSKVTFYIDDEMVVVSQNKSKKNISDQEKNLTFHEKLSKPQSNWIKFVTDDSGFWPDKHNYEKAECAFFESLALKLKEDKNEKTTESSNKDPSDRDDKSDGDNAGNSRQSGNSSESHMSDSNNDTPHTERLVADLPGGIGSWSDYSTYLSLKKELHFDDEQEAFSENPKSLKDSISHPNPDSFDSFTLPINPSPDPNINLGQKSSGSIEMQNILGEMETHDVKIQENEMPLAMKVRVVMWAKINIVYIFCLYTYLRRILT